jgi:hypothetical protein
MPMKTFLTGLLATALALASSNANAALIASFAQNPSATPTTIATDNGTTTNIDITNISTAVTAGEIIGNSDFSFHATSVSPATSLATLVVQLFTGSFCFTSGDNCTGTNFLSGNFSDAAFGALGGPGLGVNVNNPPDTLVLTSSVLTASDLAAPSTFGLTFANLTPVLAIDGSTIAAFTADFSGTVSSSAVATSEPAPLAILGIGLLGLGMVTYRKRDNQI